MTTTTRTFVLVHGAWHGGWCWHDVAAQLRNAGHAVYAPTMTGLGERAHLLRADTGLSTCIEDICASIEAEELHDIVLVGHSFAGVVISGVADRLARSIRRLVYLDALVVQHGQSALSVFPQEVQQERMRTIDAEGLRMAIPDASKFGVTEAQQVAWLKRRLTPHPLKAYTDALLLQNPLGNGLPKTYVAVTNPWYAPLASVREAVRAQADWNYCELSAGHDAMVTSPGALADLLCALAG
jgi:pimeloyl-ACP methyl ester carboxylesterase